MSICEVPVGSVRSSVRPDAPPNAQASTSDHSSCHNGVRGEYIGHEHERNRRWPTLPDEVARIITACGVLTAKSPRSPVFLGGALGGAVPSSDPGSWKDVSQQLDSGEGRPPGGPSNVQGSFFSPYWLAPLRCNGVRRARSSKDDRS